MIASTGQPSAASRTFSLASVSGSSGVGLTGGVEVEGVGAWLTHWAEPMQTERSTSMCQRSPIF